MKKAYLFVLAAVLAASAAFAAPRGEEMRVGVAIDAKNFDPHNSVDTFSFSMQKQIYEPLFVLDGNAKEPAPMLAESYEMLDDCTYKIHLRQGVKFHNGEELTAEDVVYSYKRLIDPKRCVVAKTKGADIDPDGFEIIDKYTVIIRTRGPIGGWVSSMKPFQMIFNKKAVEEAGDDYFRNPVGTGPYKFVKWTKGEKVELEAFDDYWGVKPYAKKLTFYVIPDNSSRIIALETGKLDMSYAVPSADYDRVVSEGKVKVVKVRGPILLHLAMNMDSPKLQDVRVRKAIDAAISKEAYCQVVYNGNATPGVGPLPTASTWLPENPVKWDYNPELAKKLLAEAGVKDLELTLIVMNAADRIDGATVLQSMLGQVGIKVNIEVYENAVVNDKVRNDPSSYDMYCATWGMQNSHDAGVYWTGSIQSVAVGSTNNARFSDAEVDELVYKANRTIDEKARGELFQKVWDRVNDLHPWVYLCQADELHGAQKDLIGVEDLLDGKINLLSNLHYPEQERLK